MATLINMELSKAEAKQEVTPEADAPKYPWGLCLTLDYETLKKLNIDKLPNVGSTMKIIALAEVSAVRSYASQNQSDDTSVDLQITEMSVEDGDVMGRAMTTLYGS